MTALLIALCGGVAISNHCVDELPSFRLNCARELDTAVREV